MTKILDWRKSDDPRDVVHLAVQAIAEGHIVAVPSDACYLLIASGLKPQAVRQLAEFAANSGPRKLSVLTRSADESLDLFPDISAAARRLIRKAWPGPLALELQDSHELSSLRCLENSVSAALVSPNERLRIWQPAHEVLHHISRLCSGPLLGITAPSQNSSKASAMNAGDIVPGHCVLTIDDGSAEMPGEPTVVAIDNNIGRVVESGTLSIDRLRELSQLMILFVCTGNTCRSPMAQVLMQNKINERFAQFKVDGTIPIIARSAGVSAFGGDPASHGAQQAIQSFKGSLSQHQSTQLNSELVEQADIILAMGSRHRNVIVSQWPQIAYKVHLISPDGGEISDPFGGPLDVYQKCAAQLEKHTTYWIETLDTSSLIQWQ